MEDVIIKDEEEKEDYFEEDESVVQEDIDRVLNQNQSSGTATVEKYSAIISISSTEGAGT